jgi:branched-chain amino acid transport system permease protein
MNGYVSGLLILVGINIIAVVGVSVLTGFTRLFSFGNAGFMSIGAYTSAILTTKYNVPFIPALLVGVGLTALFSLGLGKITLKLRGDYFLMATLGFGESVRLLMEFLDKYTGGARGYGGIKPYTTLPIVVVSVVLAIAGAWNFIHSKYGRNLTAVRESEEAAEAVGIDTAKAKQMSFTFSAIYAGLAGVLFAHYMMFLTPNMFDLNKSIELITTVVIGGMGSLTGSILASALITLLPELLRSAQNYRMLLYGIAVVLVITLRPTGLMGYKEFSLSWFKKRPSIKKATKL